MGPNTTDSSINENSAGSRSPREAQLVQAAIDGDREAFAELVRLYQKPIFSLAYNYTHHREDSFDICQDVFIKAFCAISDFRQEASFSTWIHRICINTCIDFIKSGKRKSFNEISLTRFEDDRESAELEIPDSSESPETLFAKTQTRRAIDSAIDALPEKYRQIILLREINGLQYEQIAGITGLSCGTVKSRLNRARSRLKKALSELL